jgi:hypothetical protein
MMNHCAFCFHKNSCPEASFRQWCEKYRDADDHEDWRARALTAEAKLRKFSEVIERNQKDLPAEFSRLVDDHFWELV